MALPFGNALRVLSQLKSDLPRQTLSHVQSKFATGDAGDDFSHIHKRKTVLQMGLISACVCGIEFCYAAETAFVTPILLQIGVPVMYMTLVWCLSPVLGIVLVPFLGSLSDKCPYRMGRRRPFIIILSCGIVIGLILVPEGKSLGKMLGDIYTMHIQFDSEAVTTSGYDVSMNGSIFIAGGSYDDDIGAGSADLSMVTPEGGTTSETGVEVTYHRKPHPWSILFTVVGVVLLDFSCDACQSPCRAYMLDVTTMEDHPTGLSTFTLLAGLGGSLGYVFGGVHWGSTDVGESFSSHVRVVFSIVLVLYLICLVLTLTSMKEVPLAQLNVNAEDLQVGKKKKDGRKYKKFTNEDVDGEEIVEQEKSTLTNGSAMNYGLQETSLSMHDTQRMNTDLASVNSEPVSRTHDGGSYQNEAPRRASSLADAPACPATPRSDGRRAADQAPLLEPVSLRTYLRSILQMPRSLGVLCLTNLFCWMSLVCYSLYFTDFVGQAVFGGNPSAPEGSPPYVTYETGVRMGSCGMALYSLSCSIYSLLLERILKRFGARRVYVGSQLVYTVGSFLMALSRSKVAVILLSPTAGIMYATLFTMPYVLVAHYHSLNTFEGGADGGPASEEQRQSANVRGLGTDVALVSSMVFLAQFFLSSFMGSIVHYTGSTVAVVVSASVLSACGALSATQVLYLDL